MINGTHAIVYSTDADADRDFIRDKLGFPNVDAGGWLLFQLPPAEFGVHPTEGASMVELYLMCDDLEATVADLAAKGVAVPEERIEAHWGIRATIPLPSGATIGLYEPRHPVARGL